MVFLAEMSRVGLEREDVFKARPHPDLLLQEKEQHEDIFGFKK
jgi:hypothetical protein